MTLRIQKSISIAASPGKVWKALSTFISRHTLMKIFPPQLLPTLNLAAFNREKDFPANYDDILYQLEAEPGKTTLYITQENISDEKTHKQIENAWENFFSDTKMLLERQEKSK